MRPDAVGLQSIWDKLYDMIVATPNDTQHDANLPQNYVKNELNLLTKRAFVYVNESFTTYIVSNAVNVTTTDADTSITLSNSYTSTNGDTVNTFQIIITMTTATTRFITFSSPNFVSVNLLISANDIN